MKTIRWIMAKELREIIRDRRVMISAFLTPVVMVVLLFQLMGYLERSITSDRTVVMTIVGPSTHPLAKQLRDADRISVRTAPNLDIAQRDLRRGSTSLAVVFGDPTPDGRVSITAYFDSERPLSMGAAGALREAVAEANRRSLGETLKTAGIDERAASPIELKTEPVGSGKGMGASLAMLIPYLVILWAFYGGMGIVGDMVSGEKEKGTLETLLASPARRIQIVVGKLLALMCLCFASGLSSLLGLALAVLINPSRGAGGFQLGILPVLSFVAVLAALAGFYASLMLAVSAQARSVRENQTYLTLVSFLIMMPAVMSQFIGLTGDDQAAWVQWTPVLNASVALGQALRGQVDAVLLAKCILVPGILAGILAWWAIRTFEKESILRRA